MSIANINNEGDQASEDDLEQLAKVEDELRKLVAGAKVHLEKLSEKQNDYDKIKDNDVLANVLESSGGENYDNTESGIKDNSATKGYGRFPSSHKNGQESKHRTEVKKVKDIPNKGKKYSKHLKSKSLELDDIIKMLNDTLLGDKTQNNHKSKTEKEKHKKLAKSKDTYSKQSRHNETKPMTYDDISRMLDTLNPVNSSRFVSNSKNKKYKSRPYLNLGVKKTNTESYLYDYEQDGKSNVGVFLLETHTTGDTFSNSSATIEENLSPWDIRYNSSCKL